LVVEVCLLGQTEVDGAIAIFDGDIAEWRCAGEIDGAVAIGDEDVSGYALEGDVAVAGGESEWADGLAAGDVGVADVDLTVEASELKVGAAGVELDGAANALEVGGAEEVAAHGDGAAEVGECGVVTTALDGDWAGDAVGGDIGVAVVDVCRDRAGDGAEFDVAVVGGDLNGRFEASDTDVAVVGVNHDGCGGRNGNGEVGAGSIEGGHGEGDVSSVGIQARAKLLRFAVGFGVRASVDLFVDGDVDLVVVAGAGDGDVAARIVD